MVGFNNKNCIVTLFAASVLLFAVHRHAVAATATAEGGGFIAPSDFDTDPLFASVSATEFFASATVAGGTLKALAEGGPGDPSNIFLATGHDAASSLSISFTNTSVAPIALPAGSISMLVDVEYTRTIPTNPFTCCIFLQHTIRPTLQATTSTAITNAIIQNSVVVNIDTDGSISSSGIDFLPTANNGGLVNVTTNDFDRLVAELLLGPLTVEPGDSLLVDTSLRVFTQTNFDAKTIIDASNTAQLLFQLPAGVSIDDFAVDTTADLVWVVPVPEPSTFFLAVASLLGLAFSRPGSPRRWRC